MSTVVCCIIFGFFIILGIVQTIEFLILKTFALPKNLNIEINSENAEFIIRSKITQSAWRGETDSIKIIYPNHEINHEVKKICNFICKNCLIKYNL